MVFDAIRSFAVRDLPFHRAVGQIERCNAAVRRLIERKARHIQRAPFNRPFERWVHGGSASTTAAASTGAGALRYGSLAEERLDGAEIGTLIGIGADAAGI